MQCFGGQIVLEKSNRTLQYYVLELNATELSEGHLPHMAQVTNGSILKQNKDVLKLTCCRLFNYFGNIFWITVHVPQTQHYVFRFQIRHAVSSHNTPFSRIACHIFRYKNKINYKQMSKKFQ